LQGIEEPKRMIGATKSIRRTRVLALLGCVVIIGFLSAYMSLVPIRIYQMQSSMFFIEEITPVPYWIGLTAIAVAAFMLIRFVKNHYAILLSVFSSILLLTCIRMVFPSTFVNIPSYEPDAASYINIVNTWLHTGVDFGQAGNYQHDFPLSFITAYAFTKMGVPIETFFRVAPFFIYAIDIILVFLLIAKVSDSMNGAVAAFLLSFSSLGYWMTVHYSPDLVGTLFYLLSLYLTYSFVKRGETNIRTLFPVLLSIFLLILSHHLSTVFFIITVFGLAFSAWFFKSPLKNRSIWFLLFAVYAYTLWFVYGTFMYPSFFNVYVYINGFTSPSSLAVQASLLDNITFWAYPALVLGLFLLGFLKTLGVKNVTDIAQLPRRVWLLHSSQTKVSEALVYSCGFLFVALLFLAGFVIPATFPLRVLEVIMIGAYPFSSQSFLKYSSGNPSWKKTILMLVLFLLVVIMGFHRYYRQIQKRVLAG
jgi:hypothetical protein